MYDVKKEGTCHPLHQMSALQTTVMYIWYIQLSKATHKGDNKNIAFKLFLVG